MDQLTLKSLTYNAFHGYYEKERTQGNKFEVDVMISADLSLPGETDRLKNTINYEQLCDTVSAIMYGPSFKLIETLAQKIGETIFISYQDIKELEVRLRKLSPPLSVNCSYTEVAKTWQR